MGVGAHLYKITCWESFGKWRCNDIQNLAGPSGKWYTPMRILDLSVEEYIFLLIDTFHAQGFNYYAPTDLLSFYFTKEKDAKAFCSYINKRARQLNYICK
jgi:hypothetical protein